MTLINLVVLISLLNFTIRNKILTYDPSCKIITTFTVTFTKTSSIIPATMTQSYPVSQQIGYKILFGLQYIDVAISGNQYNFQIAIVLLNLTQVTFSCNTPYLSNFYYIVLRCILYAPYISQFIYVDTAFLSGPYSAGSSLQYITIPSANIYNNSIVQVYLSGFHSFHRPIIKISALPTGSIFINSFNQITLSIDIQSMSTPAGYIQQISILYIVLTKQVIPYQQAKIQFSLAYFQLPNTQAQTSIWKLSSSSNPLFISQIAHYGIVSLMIDPVSIAYHGLINSPGVFIINYFHSFYAKFDLILAKLTNISASGNCCRKYTFDWGDNSCSACDENSYINFYPNGYCSWMCSECCYYPIWECYNCINPNTTLVSGGCTDVKGCIQVVSTVSSSLCIKCDVGFKGFNPTTNKCQCYDGYWLVAGLCTNIRGCIGVRKIKNSVACVVCSIYQHYVHNGIDNCVCSQGYYFDNSSLTCTQICGDGKLLQLDCDDGNNKDGDGCSEKCKVQKYYKCVNGSVNSASKCVFQIKNISIQLKFIDRVGYQHKGEFVFQILTIPNVSLTLSMIQSLQFITSKNTVIQSFKIQDHSVVVLINYGQTIEGQSAILKINFNKNKLNFTYTDLSLDMKSHNIYLTYEENDIYFTKIIPIILVPLYTFTALVGLLTHKITGAQQIHSMLLIFFVYLQSSGKNVALIPIQYISLLNQNIKYLQSRRTNVNSNRFGLQELQASLYLCFFVNLFLTFCVMARVIIMKFIDNHKYIMILQIMGKIYHRIVFPIGFCSIFISVYGRLIYEANNMNNNLIIYMCIFSIIESSILCFNQFFGCLYGVQQPESFKSWSGIKNCSNVYLPIYIIYMWLCISVFAVNQLGLISNKYISLSIFILTLCIFFYICKLPPYENSYENMSQIFNLIIVLYFSGWFFIRQRVLQLKELNNQLILFNLFNLILGVTIILSFLRSYNNFQKMICGVELQKWMQQKQSEKCKGENGQQYLIKTNMGIRQYQDELQFNKTFQCKMNQQLTINIKKQKQKQNRKKNKKFINYLKQKHTIFNSL